MKSTLKEFMPGHVRRALGNLPTFHSNCMDASGGPEFGVARPGKTARDRANGQIPYKKNRRMYDPKTGKWNKV